MRAQCAYMYIHSSFTLVYAFEFIRWSDLCYVQYMYVYVLMRYMYMYMYMDVYACLYREAHVHVHVSS